ncbi:MAG: sigma-E factor negative regulatory protein, partial [Wenzhouxiangellaceae bacterium]
MKPETSQQQHFESISALIDGELERDQARFMLQRLVADVELRRGWERMNAVRACMQREFSGRVSLVEQVASRLDTEAAPEAPAGRLGSWLRYGMGGAVAAGV